MSLLTSGQKNRSLSSSFAFIFNPSCTYHAQASQGCEQERMDYTLNNKRRVIRLVMQWAAVHGDRLKDEEEPVAFLQVRRDNTHQLGQFPCSVCPLLSVLMLQFFIRSQVSLCRINVWMKKLILI